MSGTVLEGGVGRWGVQCGVLLDFDFEFDFRNLWVCSL
jgi:hypothetical protein